ncbi:MAG: ADP-ribosylglycohydrolase family protein, partial [Planctomycetales bacterium]|nr:ADP-ribosylglycohydrolase family protein [Planctomycetales bacterium]
MSNADLAIVSLKGLSIGDALGAALGEGVSTEAAGAEADHGALPGTPWQWTDDTHMALSVVEVLLNYGEIYEDALAERFAQRYSEEPYRCYGEGAAWLLRQYADGESWRELAKEVFQGGSYGNGAAMRAAPIGAYFASDPATAADQARKSAMVTHRHPDGQAGAIAAGSNRLSGSDLLSAVLLHVPMSETRDGIEAAMEFPPSRYSEAVKQLGVGWNVTAQDTVPFCLWCAAHHIGDFKTAIWQTLRGGG